MIIRCLVADDEPIARQIVVGYIEKIPYLQLIATCKDAFEVMEQLRQNEIDLLFLDINMPRLSGLSLLRTLSNRPEVILTTAYKEYALEGFELSVIDYLLKPFSLERFLQAVQKVEEKMKPAVTTVAPVVVNNAAATAHTFVKVDRLMVKVVFAEIHYVSAFGNYIKIHLTDNTLLSHQTLGQFLEILPQDQFIQIHKSHIVNLEQVNAVDGNRVKVGEEWLAVGKAHRTKLKEWLSNF